MNINPCKKSKLDTFVAVLRCFGVVWGGLGWFGCFGVVLGCFHGPDFFEQDLHMRERAGSCLVRTTKKFKV